MAIGDEPREPCEEYLALVQRSPDAILIDRIGRGVEFANPAAVALFGARTAGDLVGRSAFELIHPDDHARAREHMERFLRREARSDRIELTIVRLDGSTRLVDAHAAALQDATGDRIEVVVRDVTERKRIEDALHESEERLRAHIDNSPLAIVEFDPEFRVIGWSKGAERVFGWTAGEIVGRRIAELRWVHEDDAESVRRESERLLKGSETRTLNANRNYRKDGEVIHCEWYSSALHDAQGRLLSVMSQVLDITDRVRAEGELRAVDQRKTEFLAVLSHELRNCLAPIDHGLRVLERTPPGSRSFARAQAIVRRQIEHVTRLVDDLLDLSRINAGKIRLERQLLDARGAVRSVCEEARRMFEERGVALRVDVAAEPLWVDADETRLKQMVRNLLGNALKFTQPPGSVSVSVDRRERELEVRVRDTGRGIAPEALRKIFEPYVQASDPHGHGGMGIGLALVKTFATMHRGTVSADSAGEGKGAEFVVSLPLTAPPTGPREAQRRARVPGPSPSLDILVVEDNRDAAETLETLLQLQGHRTRVAFDARSALEAFRVQPAEVIIADVGLPDTSGYELIRELRQLEGGRRAFAVAVTGYAQQDDVDRAKQAGFDVHLAKPVAVDRLDTLLAEACEHVS